MTNSNRIKLTWISFLSYALTGALVIVTGMVMGNIADYFNLPVSSMSNTFTFLNAGILISIFLNAWLMEIVPLKTQLRFGFLLMVLAVAGLMFSHSLALFSAAMFILGVVSGITMSIGTFLVTQMYEGRQRGSRLLFTDSFFSMAGMIFPMIAAFLLARSIEWYWVYACIGLVYVAIFILTFGCEFPALGKQYADPPLFFLYRSIRFWRMFAQRRELTAEGQNKNSDIHQPDAGINPVPLNAARQ